MPFAYMRVTSFSYFFLTQAMCINSTRSTSVNTRYINSTRSTYLRGTDDTEDDDDDEVMLNVLGCQMTY